MVALLLERVADLSVRAKLPGYYERPDELVECTRLRSAIPRALSPRGEPEDLRSATRPRSAGVNICV